MANSDHTSIYARACAYPFVSEDMFAQSRVVDIDTGAAVPLSDTVGISLSPFNRQLPDSPVLLPGYNLNFSSGLQMSDRIAMIAIGSNSSPEVLIKKFREANIGGSFLLAQALIEHHAVVHGAFIGAAGTIPATIVPHHDSRTFITVSFLTTEQAVKLTGTEPNYDLVKMATPISTRGIAGTPVIAPGAMAYVSPWNSLSKDGQNPVSLSSIPAQTMLERLSSAEACAVIAGYLDATASTEDCFNRLDLGIDARLRTNYLLQARGLPARIAGEQVKGATIGTEAASRGLPVPSIQYVG